MRYCKCSNDLELLFIRVQALAKFSQTFLPFFIIFIFVSPSFHLSIIFIMSFNNALWTTTAWTVCYWHGCQSYGKVFTKNFYLHAHICIVHARIRPHQCKFCPSSFDHLTKLKEHELTHTKRFKCTFCQKTFPRKSDLKTHMKIHTGEGLHKYTICDHATTDTSTLKRHIKAKHPSSSS